MKNLFKILFDIPIVYLEGWKQNRHNVIIITHHSVFVNTYHIWAVSSKNLDKCFKSVEEENKAHV